VCDSFLLFTSSLHSGGTKHISPQLILFCPSPSLHLDSPAAPFGLPSTFHPLDLAFPHLFSIGRLGHNNTLPHSHNNPIYILLLCPLMSDDYDDIMRMMMTKWRVGRGGEAADWIIWMKLARWGCSKLKILWPHFSRFPFGLDWNWINEEKWKRNAIWN
jgi:hypothetical protein